MNQAYLPPLSIRRATAFAVALLLVAGYVTVLAPPADFPAGDLLVIPKGASLPDIVKQFSDARVVKHPEVLRSLLRLSGAGSRVQSGAYLFSSPENVLTIAYRLATGEHGLPPVRLTFPEGMTVREMALKIGEAMPAISPQDFIAAAKSKEGYLFPDTYLFSPDASIEVIMTAMRKNFDEKISSLSRDIQASGHSLGSIVIMASLLEKEARTDVNRRLVAGVLWNRLFRGMPLQVDAVFGYIYNRDTYSPSFADLKVNSPYNTYTHVGLPPGPINNPGIDALTAALHPTKTDYLYYLTDKEGVMHYAKTYAAHQANEEKYLR